MTRNLVHEFDSTHFRVVELSQFELKVSK